MSKIKHLQKCPFCRSELKEYVFFESENFLATYNIAPILPGHSLVIPKKHIESLLDLSDKELFEFVSLGRSVVKILTKAFDTDSFNWTIQEKPAAGQTVPHLHMHLIPRKSDDLPEVGDWYPLLKQRQSEIIDSEFRSKLSPEEMYKIVQHIKRIAKNIKM